MCYHSPLIIRPKARKCLEGFRIWVSTRNKILGLRHYSIPYLCKITLDHDDKAESFDSLDNSSFS